MEKELKRIAKIIDNALKNEFSEDWSAFHSGENTIKVIWSGYDETAFELVYDKEDFEWRIRANNADAEIVAFVCKLFI